MKEITKEDYVSNLDRLRLGRLDLMRTSSITLDTRINFFVKIHSKTPSRGGKIIIDNEPTHYNHHIIRYVN